MLENQLNLGTDRTEILEVQLKEARALATESDKKYDEVARKLIIQENELEKAEDRAKRSEMYVCSIPRMSSLSWQMEFYFRKCADLEHEMKNLHHQLKSCLAHIDDVTSDETMNWFDSMCSLGSDERTKLWRSTSSSLSTSEGCKWSQIYSVRERNTRSSLRISLLRLNDDQILLLLRERILRKLSTVSQVFQWILGLFLLSLRCDFTLHDLIFAVLHV